MYDATGVAAGTRPVEVPRAQGEKDESPDQEESNRCEAGEGCDEARAQGSPPRRGAVLRQGLTHRGRLPRLSFWERTAFRSFGSIPPDSARADVSGRREPRTRNQDGDAAGTSAAAPPGRPVEHHDAVSIEAQH